jgi:hypothetical protein
MRSISPRSAYSNQLFSVFTLTERCDRKVAPAKLSMVRGLEYGCILEAISVKFYEKLKELIQMD